MCLFDDRDVVLGKRNIKMKEPKTREELVVMHPHPQVRLVPGVLDLGDARMQGEDSR